MDANALEDLACRARLAAERAYVPASGFAVGAALLADDGRVFTGCNVENASFGLTICAERNAVFHAVAEGARHFVACAVHTPSKEPAYPCGACCQVLAEFGADMEIVLVPADPALQLTRVRLSEVLPHPFRFPG